MIKTPIRRTLSKIVVYEDYSPSMPLATAKELGLRLVSNNILGVRRHTPSPRQVSAVTGPGSLVRGKLVG